MSSCLLPLICTSSFSLRLNSVASRRSMALTCFPGLMGPLPLFAAAQLRAVLCLSSDLWSTFLKIKALAPLTPSAFTQMPHGSSLRATLGRTCSEISPSPQGRRPFIFKNTPAGAICLELPSYLGHQWTSCLLSTDVPTIYSVMPSATCSFVVGPLLVPGTHHFSTLVVPPPGEMCWAGANFLRCACLRFSLSSFIFPLLGISDFLAESCPCEGSSSCLLVGLPDSLESSVRLPLGDTPSSAPGGITVRHLLALPDTLLPLLSRLRCCLPAFLLL